MEYRPLGDQFNELAKDIRNNMPRLTIGKPNLNQVQSNSICPYCRKPYLMPLNQFKPQNCFNQPYINQPKEDTFSKIRRWGLWIVISVVIGYAVYRLLWGFVFK